MEVEKAKFCGTAMIQNAEFNSDFAIENQNFAVVLQSIYGISK